MFKISEIVHTRATDYRTEGWTDKLPCHRLRLPSRLPHFQGNISKASQCYLKAIQMDQKRAEYWFKYASLLFDLGKLKEAYRFLSNIDRTNRTPDVLKLGGSQSEACARVICVYHNLQKQDFK